MVRNVTVIAVGSLFLSLGCAEDGTERAENPSLVGNTPLPDASDMDAARPGNVGDASSPQAMDASLGSADAHTTDASVQSDAGASEPDAGSCWSLPVVNRARLYPMAGRAEALRNGKIVGSRSSPTNNFVDLATITATPAEGAWLELRFDNAIPYRYVKYYSPPDSYGAIAELELYADEERVSGAPFGTAGERRPDSGYERALDGDVTTAFESALPHDNYVGLDLGADHVTAAPTFTPPPGRYDSAQEVEIRAQGASRILYTTNGEDPSQNGRTYAGPVAISLGQTMLRAVAEAPCMLASEVTQGLYHVGSTASPAAQSSLHIGNSLTDTIVEHLQPMAQSAGITLDFNRYTVPGAGTWVYAEFPSGGFGVDNVQRTVRSRPFDHLSMQPFPNNPCQPTASADGNDSDAGYIHQVWADARAQNPNVQLWIFQQWPQPSEYENCMSGGAWTRPSWTPEPPTSWEHAVANELLYHEAVHAELVRLNPNASPPYIVPAGQALVALKEAIAAGEVPGMRNFEHEIFVDDGRDLHLTVKGAYMVTLVFYACMFQDNPEGKVTHANSELTAEQAAVFQRIAWQTVLAYPLSGVNR